MTAKVRSRISWIKFSNVLFQGKLLTGWGELSHNVLAFSIIASKFNFSGSPECPAVTFIFDRRFDLAFWNCPFGLKLKMQPFVFVYHDNPWYNRESCQLKEILQYRKKLKWKVENRLFCSSLTHDKDYKCFNSNATYFYPNKRPYLWRESLNYRMVIEGPKHHAPLIWPEDGCINTLWKNINHNTLQMPYSTICNEFYQGKKKEKKSNLPPRQLKIQNVRTHLN